VPLEYDTVAIPVTRGVNLTSPARLVPPVELLEAENSRFPRGGGATKRRGHYGSRVRGSKVIPPGITSPQFSPPAYPGLFSTSTRNLPSGWLWGWGVVGEDEPDPTVVHETALHPSAGILFGAAQRDNESVFWDGFRLYSRTPGQTRGSRLPEVNAVMPMLRTSAAPKVNQAQAQPEAADTGRIRVVAWQAAGATGNDVYYTVQDSVTGAIIQAATALGLESVRRLRVVNVGPWVHILVTHSADLLHRFSINNDSPRDYTQVSIGACPTYFAFWKCSESLWVVARNNGDDDAGAIRVSWHTASGAEDTVYHESSTPDLTPADADPINAVTELAIAAHPTEDEFALVWRAHVGLEGGEYIVFGARYDLEGGSADDVLELKVVEATDDDRPVTVAPSYLSVAGVGVYTAYFDAGNSSPSTVLLYSIRFSEAVDNEEGRYRLFLASSAFRVGQRTFTWVARSSERQSQFFLVDEALNPVGRAEYITANVLTTERSLSTVNWRGTDTHPVVFHGALGYRVRVATEPPSPGDNEVFVYADPSIKFYELDFLPPLRSAQAGRTLYFPGAQLWSYDGHELTEAGFHVIPEDVTVSASGSGGGLETGDYIYRVDLCYRNAHNEEIRSASFYTDPVAVGAGQEVAVNIPTCFTSRDDAYFLIFRNEVDGTQWYLVNSRDPEDTQFVVNDQTQTSMGFVDDGVDTPTDAELVAQELHPGNSGFNYLDQYSAPASEIIAAGHDRLWLAGGELAPGQVLPSRLFEPGETPSWNGFLVLQVDRSIEPITAIGFVGETRVFFRETQAYVQQGEGPSNVLSNTWEPVRLAYADMGAVGPESLALVTSGLVFQSPAGIRMMSPGGGVQNIGQNIDFLARESRICATVVSAPDQEVRFYTYAGPTLVFNYQHGIWSTWTINCAGAVRNADTGLAILGTQNGNLWEEQDDLWTDYGRPYRHRVRFSWLRRGDLMDFQRVRRVGALGECDHSEAHKVHVDIYYDEREFAEECFDFNYPDPGSQNTDEFGNNSFGSGSFGDTEGIE
jgi:hypothetical protein